MQTRIGALLSAATLALCGIGSAQAQDQGSHYTTGPYVGIAGGGSFLNDISPHGAGADVNSRFDDGYAGLLTLGYGFGNGFRMELEGGYRRNDVDSVRGSVRGTNSGALGMTTVMANGIFDLDLSQYGMDTGGFMPHIGVGAGWAQPRFDHAGLYNGNTMSGKDDLFAYQGIVGFDYPLTPHMKLNLDYHYLGTDIGHFNISPGVPGATLGKTSITDHTVLIGVRYAFDAPEAPVPMAPPPPPPPAAAPPPPPPPPPAVEAQRQFQVFFDFDKSDITDAARQVIQQAANTIKSGHSAQIKVTGHTDTVGSARYNQGLSERRAAAVKAELLNDGIPDSQVTTLGVGKTDLLVPTADGVREPQNRRATIELE